MEPNNSGLKTWQWVVTAIVIVILIVIGIFVFGKKTPSTTTENNGTMSSTTPAMNQAGTTSIVMSDQYPGNVVYVSSVTSANGAWVAIHKDNKGEPGAVIGSAWVAAGTNPAKITVSSPIVDGGVYYAMLHTDDGDKKFDAAKDLPMKDSNGNAIMRVFHGSVSAGNSVKG